MCMCHCPASHRRHKGEWWWSASESERLIRQRTQKRKIENNKIQKKNQVPPSLRAGRFSGRSLPQGSLRRGPPPRTLMKPDAALARAQPARATLAIQEARANVQRTRPHLWQKNTHPNKKKMSRKAALFRARPLVRAMVAASLPYTCASRSRWG